MNRAPENTWARCTFIQLREVKQCAKAHTACWWHLLPFPSTSSLEASIELSGELKHLGSGHLRAREDTNITLKRKKVGVLTPVGEVIKWLCPWALPDVSNTIFPAANRFWSSAEYVGYLNMMSKESTELGVQRPGFWFQFYSGNHSCLLILEGLQLLFLPMGPAPML